MDAWKESLRQKYTYLYRRSATINTIMCDSSSENSMINKVVTICCVLCNCCDSIVPFE